jgi:hypothetical protein
MTLTFDELHKELSLYSYRPGWMFTLWNDPHEGFLLYIVAKVIDSADPEKETELRINSWVPPMETRKQFCEWLFWRLRQIEIHECMEWFKRRGQSVFDPHADKDPPMDEVKQVWKQMLTVRGS